MKVSYTSGVQNLLFLKIGKPPLSITFSPSAGPGKHLPKKTWF